MIKFFQFLRRIYVFLLFVVLEALCLHYYADSTPYTRSRLLALSNRWVGGVYQATASTRHYLNLGRENEQLVDQLVDLHNRLSRYEGDPEAGMKPDSAMMARLEGELAPYHYMAARVVGNSTTRQENYLTLNRGLRDDVEADMAVVSPAGHIVGYVLSCSEKFAACISVLNKNFRTSGRLKNADYSGSIYWDGRSNEHLMLSDIPRYASVAVGDTILTSDYSAIFPPGVLVGTIESWTLNQQTYCYDIRVRIFASMGALREVLLVRYLDANERNELEELVGGELKVES